MNPSYWFWPRVTILVLFIALGSAKLLASAGTFDGMHLAPHGASISIPTEGQIEVGFSPEGSAIELVLKAINSAHKSIHVMAYVMTNREITAALISAVDRGVAVSIEADHKENIVEDRYGTAQGNLRALRDAGATVCTVSAYPIFHDKAMILDGTHVETGSFNYSLASASKNSENAIVFWNSPALASEYDRHFKARISMCANYAG